jgi:hypothetical protein
MDYFTYSSVLKMEIMIMSSSKMLGFLWTTCNYNFEDHSLHSHHCELINSVDLSTTEGPPVVHPLKQFPAFCGTQRFVTTFTRALHLSLSRARLIQSIPSIPPLQDPS